MDSHKSEVWVVAESRPGAVGAEELIGKARELADALPGTQPGSTAAVLMCAADCAEAADMKSLACAGADRVVRVLGKTLPWDRASCGRALAALIKRERPQIVLAAATAFGRSVMPYAAALCGAGLTADCTGLSIEPDSGLLLQTRPAIGGNVMATIKTPNRKPQMATVRPRTFRPMHFPGKSCAIEEVRHDDPAGEAQVKTISFTPFDETGDISEYDAVVAGGRGLRRAEGFELLARLASALGGAVGASRPTVEMKWITYPHQVGLSGRVVSPKLYVAAGISGSVQHLAGMATAGKIVAINRDPDAPIFRASDIAICGDLYDIIPQLIEKIEKRRAEI